MYNFYKKCEESLKKTILDQYGNFLNENQKNLFNEKEYVTDEALGIKNLNEIFDFLSTKMLNDLLNVNCTKDINIDNETDISVPCGETLKKILVNFYKRSIANKINFKPVINYNYANDLDLLNFINQEFDNKIDKNVFNKNILELSEIEELSLYINDKISSDIKEYMNRNNLLYN